MWGMNVKWLTIVGLLLVVACGQKGPLYLPNGESPEQQESGSPKPQTSGGLIEDSGAARVPVVE